MSTPTQWPDWTPDQPGDQAPPPPPPGTEPDPTGWGAPPEPSRGRGLLIVAIVAALLIGTGLLGAAGYLVSRDADPIELADPVPAEPDVDGPADESGTADEPPIDADDFDRPTDVVTAELLESIDAAELTMIEFQIRASDGIDTDGTLLDGGEALVQDASRTGAEALSELEGRLSAIEPGGSGAVTEGHLAIRDTYRDHLVAWKDWMTAIQSDPALLEDGNAAAAPFGQDIADTAEDFVTELRVSLPEGTPDQLRAFADFILDRGFGGPSAPGGELA